MKKRDIVINLVVALLIAAYLVFTPDLIVRSIEGSGSYYDMLASGAREEYTGIITIWHIAGFKPYLGSMTSWLGDAAKDVERSHFGIFVEVVGMSAEEYEQRVLRGESADIYSFPMGWGYPERFLELRAAGGSALMDASRFKGNLSTCGEYGADGAGGSSVYALPFALSGYMLLTNARYTQEMGMEPPENGVDSDYLLALENALVEWDHTKKPQAAYSVYGGEAVAVKLGIREALMGKEEFTQNKALSLVCDARSAGDFDRAYLAGNGVLCDAYAASSWTDLVQLVGVSRHIQEEKLPYALEFMQRLLSEKQQRSLCNIGLVPVCEIMGEEPVYGRNELQQLYTLLMTPETPNAFTYSRYAAALKDAATRTLLGEADARKEFDERLSEVAQPLEIHAEIQ